MEDGVAGKRGDVGFDGGQGGAKGDLLRERVGGEGGKRREFDGDGVVAGAEVDGVGPEGDVDGGGGVLGHDVEGSEEREQGVV